MEQRNPPIELRLLRYFVTVAEEMHFGRAAARLAMTQPPLSQAIRALEEALGVALFVRTKRTVELTPVGKDLLPEVRRLLASADTLRPLAQSLARGEAGVLSLAFVSTADYGLLPSLLARFRRALSRRAAATDRGDQRRADRGTDRRAASTRASRFRRCRRAMSRRCRICRSRASRSSSRCRRNSPRNSAGRARMGRHARELAGTGVHAPRRLSETARARFL